MSLPRLIADAFHVAVTHYFNSRS